MLETPATPQATNNNNINNYGSPCDRQLPVWS